MERVTHALTTLTETHQTSIAIEAMTAVLIPMLSKNYPEGASYLADLLRLTLPGIDANDMLKTQSTLRFYIVVLASVPIFNSVSASSSSYEGFSGDSDLLHRQPVFPSAAIQVFEEWCSEFLDRTFEIVGCTALYSPLSLAPSLSLPLSILR